MENKTEGLTLRDAIAEDYQLNGRRLGADVPWADAEKLAQADLELVDRHNSEAKPAPPPRPHIITEEENPEPSLAETMAENDGMTFVQREVPDDEKQVETLGNINHEKRLKLINRIHAISEKDPATGDWHYPEFANALVHIHANWNMASAGARGIKGYSRVRSQVERDRIFFRQLEDLCDFSTGRMGPWWIK